MAQNHKTGDDMKNTASHRSTNSSPLLPAGIKREENLPAPILPREEPGAGYSEVDYYSQPTVCLFSQQTLWIETLLVELIAILANGYFILGYSFKSIIVRLICHSKSKQVYSPP